MDEATSHSPEKEQGELMNIVGDTEVGEPCMFGKDMHLSVFYCLCCVKDISTYMSEDQVVEERYLELNEEEDIRLDAIRENIGGVFMRKVTIIRRLMPLCSRSTLNIRRS